MFIVDAMMGPPIRGREQVYDDPDGLILNTISVNGIRKKRGFPPLRAGMTLDDFMAEMDGAGVRHGVVGGREGDGPLLDLISRFPGRFSGVIGWDPSTCVDVHAYVAAAREKGIKGVSVASGLPPQRLYADDRRNYPLFEAARAAGLILYVGAAGSVGPDQSYSAPLQVDRIAGDFAELPIVVGHAGFPHVQEICGVLYRRTNVHLILDHYFGGLPGEADYLLAAGGYGQDRMLFGTCFPDCPFEDQIARFQSLPLSELIKEKLLGLNAARLLGLEA
jgi:hypothetical protein